VDLGRPKVRAVTAPRLFQGLFDDAAMFPPGDAPLREALAAHRRYRTGPLAPYVGPLLVAAGVLGELSAALAAQGDGTPLPVVLIVRGGADGADRALPGALGEPAAPLVGVEAACRPEGDAAEEVAALAAVLDRDLPDGVGACVEIPRGSDPRPALDALVGTEHRAKFRTGGVRAQAFPDERELAGFLHAAVERGLAFKCTAGLHHAVRHTAPDTGFEHHGFLNALLAAHAALGGAPGVEVAALLALRDGPRLADMAAALSPAEAATLRESFLSYGTCSVTEPIDDLVRLGLLPAPGDT
jgi:hypothetical protein